MKWGESCGWGRSSSSRRSSVLGSVLAFALAACGDDGGAGSGGGAGAKPELLGARAPMRDAVLVELTGPSEAAPTEPSAYRLDSPQGALEVVAVTAEEAALRLTTAPQKLGVTYELSIEAPGNGLDGARASFVAADEALFWKSVGTSSTEFEQVKARRVGVGERVVLYAAEGVSPVGVEETIADFDQNVFPGEVALFGPPPDRDGNGRIVVLGVDSKGLYGGYYSPTNALSAAQAEAEGLRSNEMEMLYVSVPQLDGHFDRPDAQVIPHELAHLFYREMHTGPRWMWHNEGIAECAVHAVRGPLTRNAQTYASSSHIQNGISLVRWTQLRWDNYVQSYVFLAYLASRLDGVASFAELAAIPGDPAVLGPHLESRLGKSFGELYRDMLAAAYVQAPTGPYGFEGFLPFPFKPTPLDPSLAAPRTLLPMVGVRFLGSSSPMAPLGAGEHMSFLGVDGLGNASTNAPFMVDGGVLVALNLDPALAADEGQSTGSFPEVAPDGTDLAPRAATDEHEDDRLWLHPPPIAPENERALEAWRRATRRVQPQR